MSATARTPEGEAALAMFVAEPDRALLVTDYDGTLAPVVPDPEQARPAAHAVERLVELAGLLGGVAVLTGRSVESALRVGGLAAVPGLVLVGAYGAQRWEGGQLRSPPLPPVPDEVVSRVVDLVDRTAVGARVEHKGSALAVHTREAEEPDVALDRLRPGLLSIASEHGLSVHPGRMVLEIGLPGPDKADAVRGLVAERRPRVVVMVGDDLGDLRAFEALHRLRAEPGGPAALTVASRSEETPQVAAAADLVVEGPDGVVELFGQWVRALAHAPGR